MIFNIEINNFRVKKYDGDQDAGVKDMRIWVRQMYVDPTGSRSGPMIQIMYNTFSAGTSTYRSTNKEVPVI